MAPATERVGEWPHLEDGTPIYRAYRNRSDFNRTTCAPQPKVFYRRSTERGLSVGLTKQAALSVLRAEGLCQLLVGDVRASLDPLDVIQDGREHAEIVGVRLLDENAEAALRIARYLARVAVNLPLPNAGLVPGTIH